MVDADHLERVNAGAGAEAGDTMLRRIATLLRESSPAHDAVCRLGGAQFLVICPDADAIIAWTSAERLRQRIEAAALPLPDLVLNATISVGVAASDEPIAGISELLKRADLAVHEARHAGQNRVKLWSPE